MEITVLKYQNLQSTNTELLRLCAIRNDIKEGTLVRCESQREGRGQMGNRWESEDFKNLTFSILLTPMTRAAEQFGLNMCFSLSVIEVLKELFPRFADGFRLKWPNDIYYKDKKIGGILIENILEGAFIRQCVIGLGLNVNQASFPENLPHAMSLLQICGQESDLELIFDKLCASAAAYYKRLIMHSHDYYTPYCENLYRYRLWAPYRAEGTVFEGRIVSVEPAGRLNLETRGGNIRSFAFKEVEFLSATPPPSPSK